MQNQNATTVLEDKPSFNMKFLRCMDWMEKQNSEIPKEFLQNKNDIQFIIQTNADRKKFLLNSAEDEATVPTGVCEPEIEPKSVPLHRLRLDNLHMECEWQSCRYAFTNYELFQKHVKEHIPQVHVIDNNDCPEYVCLWDICGHRTDDFNEMVRHINYHAYHSRLMAIGFNARATLKLLRCKKDSTKRNELPRLLSDHCCMWTDCNDKYSSIQMFFDHVKLHINYSDEMICSWAGCGAKFQRRVLLSMHVRSHTNERIIACYHCGRHFACNRKLADHLRRQNAMETGGEASRCGMCGAWFASAYLRREHARQHVSAVACSLCDMSAPTLAALAQHVRYRHLPPAGARQHACARCGHRAVTKSDLKKHLLTHTRKRKLPKKKDIKNENESSPEQSEEEYIVKKKVARQYACHLCPKDNMKIFTRGTRLTQHLVKVHEAQWPSGHSRFRYQISEDGMYRLTTTRYEILEVSKKIVDGYSGPKDTVINSFEFDLQLKAEATETTPKRFEITLKGANNNEQEIEVKTGEQAGTDQTDKKVEITMCDVDEFGNIVNTEVITDIVYS